MERATMELLSQRARVQLFRAVTFCTVLLAATTAGLASQPEPADTDEPLDSSPAGVTVEIADADDYEISGPIDIAPLAPITREAMPPAPLDFWPPLHGPALTWFAVVVILTLTFRLRPLLSERNMDGLVLAATCLLLMMRQDLSYLPTWAGGCTGQWWAYLLLSIAAGYWLLRGLLCLWAGPTPRRESNVSSGALLILLLAGLAVSISHIASAPLSPASRDGLVGGLYMADSGRLPYGEVAGHDQRSPCIYILHAAAARAFTPEFIASEAHPPVAMSWQNRAGWQELPWWQAGDFAAARFVNAALFVALLVALYIIGRRLHSANIGLTLVGIFCIFPGTLECLARPDIMLPTTLVAWSIVVALLPGLGGLLSTFVLIFAGLAWPWAWLGLPVLLGYFFRNGLQAFGSLVGLLAGVAGMAAGLTAYTLPSLPRADGALARAGLTPALRVERTDAGVLKVDTVEPADAPQRGLLRPLWRFLVNSESVALDTAQMGENVSRVYPATGVHSAQLLFRNLHPSDEASNELARRYREQLSHEPVITRTWVALRTVLEQTWLTEQPPDLPVPAAWALWSRAEAGGGWWPLVRQLVKVAAGLLVVLTGLILWRRREAQPVHLVGGMLVAASVTLLADYAGAVTHLVWLLPAALAVWAGGDEPPDPTRGIHAAAAERIAARLNPVDIGPEPRITVDD
jgi:hypothetical protein